MEYENKCPICHDDFKDKIKHEPCGHEFCKSCIKRWYQVSRKRTCPLCRSIKNRLGRETLAYFDDQSQNEIQYLDFTLEHQAQDFPIREDSLNLIFDNSKRWCKFMAHPNTLKMFIDNHINIKIVAEIISSARVCAQINMNLDEILRDGYLNINFNINLDEENRFLKYSINIERHIEVVGREYLEFEFSTLNGYRWKQGYRSRIFTKSLEKRLSISSVYSPYYGWRNKENIDLKIELINENNTVLRPGLLLITNKNGQWKIKADSETYEFILQNNIDLSFEIYVSNMYKKNILVDLFSVKSKLTDHEINIQKIKIIIDDYENDEDVRGYNINLLKNRIKKYSIEEDQIRFEVILKEAPVDKKFKYSTLVYRKNLELNLSPCLI